MHDACLVLGGSGFLGREAVPELAKSFAVTATSFCQRGENLCPVDLRDADATARLLDAMSPAAVVVLAAYRDPDFCEEHPDEARRLNTEPVRQLARLLPPSVPMLFVSTDYVFDGENPPYTETSPRSPLSQYGRTKMEAEDFVLAHPAGAVVRVPLLMGWTDEAATSGFFSHLLADVRAQGPVVLDDVLKRYPVWTRDLGGALRTLLERRERGVFHYSTSRAWTRYEAAREMARLLGRADGHLQPSHAVVQRRAVRPRDAQLAPARWTELGLPAPHAFPEVARKFITKFNLAVDQAEQFPV